MVRPFAYIEVKQVRRTITMVTYSDLIELCILLVNLVGLCYQVFHDRKKKK